MRALMALVGVCFVIPPAGAQLPNLKSQLGSVTQMVMGTRIEVLYRRPVARGRELFGALVPYDRVWSPSADTAARFTISTPVIINGSKLAAGTYSVWAIPNVSDWTIIFSRQAVAFHMRYPEGQDVLRIHSAPVKGEYVETLEFAFPMVDADSAIFQLRWGTTVVPMKIRVAP